MERPLEVARASGLIAAGEPLLVLLSGGADSVCLLDVALRLEADVTALLGGVAAQLVALGQGVGGGGADACDRR